MISFTVLGTPEPQGSTRAFLVRGRPRITSDNPRMKPWRQQVGWEALRARAEAGYNEVYAGRHVPVRLTVDFYFKKAPSVPKKRTEMCVRPDCDKLLRSIGDSLTGILWADDGAVVEIRARKYYGLPERAEITVERI